jgi:hypothetical protein
LDHEEARGKAAERSRERAAGNPSGIGAAYIGPAGHDLDAWIWRAVVAVSDGRSVTETLVVAKSVSRHARFDAEALARSVERIVSERTGGQTLSELGQGGPGIVLDTDAGEELRDIFPG